MVKSNISRRQEWNLIKPPTTHFFFLNQHNFYLELDSNTEPIEYEAGLGLLTTTSQHSIRCDINRCLVKKRRNIKHYIRKHIAEGNISTATVLRRTHFVFLCSVDRAS